MLDQNMVLKKLKKINSKKQFNLSNTILYSKFIGLLNKKGNKKKSKNIIESSFFKVLLKIKHKKKQSLNFLLLLIFKKMNTFIEVRKIRKRKYFNFVPFVIKKNRRIYLTIK